MKQRGIEWEEYDRAVRWMAMTMIITLTVTVLLTIFSLPFSFLLEHGISRENIQSVKMFLNEVFNRPTFFELVSQTFELTRIFNQSLDSYFAGNFSSFRAYIGRHFVPVSFSIKRARFGTPCNRP